MPKTPPPTYPNHRVATSRVVTLEADMLELSKTIANYRREQATNHAGAVEELWTQASIALALLLEGPEAVDRWREELRANVHVPATVCGFSVSYSNCNEGLWIPVNDKPPGSGEQAPAATITPWALIWVKANRAAFVGWRFNFECLSFDDDNGFLRVPPDKLYGLDSARERWKQRDAN